MGNNITTDSAPIYRARNSKSSYKLKASCLLAWKDDHKTYKPQKKSK